MIGYLLSKGRWWEWLWLGVNINNRKIFFVGFLEIKCCMEIDVGFIKVNIYDFGGNKYYYCIYFVRGCCYLGFECGYLYVILIDKDEKRLVNILCYVLVLIGIIFSDR